jgi:hypothetical protein
MAQLNFGLLNTNAPAEIAGAYGRGQQEALQMRQQTAATQGAEMNLARLKQEHDALDKLMTDITANGGPSDPLQAAQMMIDSKHPEWFAKGLAMKQSYMQLEADRQAMGLPPLPRATAPAAAPTNALAPAPASMATPTNALAPTSAPMAAPAPVNALVNNDKTAQINQAKAMLLSSNPGVRTAGEQQLKLLMAPPVMHTVAPGASLVGPDGKALFTAPERTDTDLIRNFNAAKAQGFKGNIFDYERKIKEAGRTPAQPVAPTITSIVDPANPNQMITVDARRYQGGGAGSPGVIGVAGKEPGAALRTNKVEEGKTQLQNDLDNLRSSFTELDRLRAIPSTERNVVSNLMSATAASGVGQALGRAGGSPEQVERDVINSARQRLVASIKNATGMSSKSLDSNMELQTMLRSISDPGQSVEAAMRIISDIEDAYVKGAGTMAKPGKPAAVVAPNIDALLNKYK